jgi:UDP-4-amino-4,6-dideoxy-N-acetyl-beta-L-altrosamine N-acetyltransferase
MDINYIDLSDSPEEWRELLRIWRNKPRIRSEMVFQEEISPAQHEIWLKKLLSSGATDKIRIAVTDGVPFGMIRLKDIDRKVRASDWGYYIGEEEFLGRGLGKRMLKHLVEWAFVEEELGELSTKVNKNNIKALNIYKRAGFHLAGETGDFYTMVLKNDGESKIWTIGQGGNGREMPLDLKRHFAWIFSSVKLPICIDNGALIEIKSDSDDVHLKWRDIVFKLKSHSDIEVLADKLPYADALIPKAFPQNCDWGFVSLDTKDDLGFSALLAASVEEFKKIITFCDNTANFLLNERHLKIETLAQEHKDNLEHLYTRFENLPVFAEFSLTGADDPLSLAEKIKECDYIKGISVKNDLPIHKQELPQKIITIVQDSGFKGAAQNRVFIGFREEKEKNNS